MLYAAVLTMLVYREMDLEGLHHALLETGRLTGVALFCVGTASASVRSLLPDPQALLEGVAAGDGPILTLLHRGCFCGRLRLDAIPPS